MSARLIDDCGRIAREHPNREGERHPDADRLRQQDEDADPCVGRETTGQPTRAESERKLGQPRQSRERDQCGQGDADLRERQPEGRPLLALLWMIGASLSFTLLAIAGRSLSVEMNTFELMLYRSVIGFGVVHPLVLRGGL